MASGHGKSRRDIDRGAILRYEQSKQRLVLERLDYSRNVLSNHRAAFRGTMARKDPWEPEDRLRLIQDIREVDIALKHLRTMSHLVRLHLGEKAHSAMEKLVALTKEYVRPSNLQFGGVVRELSRDEFKHRYNILFGYNEKNPFTQDLQAARDEMFEVLEPFLLS
jgi:hypothetical protein